MFRKNKFNIANNIVNKNFKKTTHHSQPIISSNNSVKPLPKSFKPLTNQSKPLTNQVKPLTNPIKQFTNSSKHTQKAISQNKINHNNLHSKPSNNKNTVKTINELDSIQKNNSEINEIIKTYKLKSYINSINQFLDEQENKTVITNTKKTNMKTLIQTQKKETYKYNLDLFVSEINSFINKTEKIINLL